jgi:hypothetical protein
MRLLCRLLHGLRLHLSLEHRDQLSQQDRDLCFLHASLTNCHQMMDVMKEYEELLSQQVPLLRYSVLSLFLSYDY